jgi:hypothetical protein
MLVAIVGKNFVWNDSKCVPRAGVLAVNTLSGAAEKVTTSCQLPNSASLIFHIVIRLPSDIDS